MRGRSLVLSFAILAAGLLGAPQAFAAQGGGQNCRMEQQCHWQNFKKVCVYVKVCR
jgi:hypothetical protein